MKLYKKALLFILIVIVLGVSFNVSLFANSTISTTDSNLIPSKKGKGVGTTIWNNFRDKKLAQVVANQVAYGDVNATITSKMVTDYKMLHARNENISFIDGLETFSNLAYINLSYNSITDLNLRPFPKLYGLEVIGSGVRNIDLTNCTELTEVNLNRNHITDENVFSYLYNLKSGSVEDNELTNIELTRNSKLLHLNANNNKLSSINLSNNPSLSELYLANNFLTDIDLRLLPSLTKLGLYQNLLTYIDVSKNNRLTDLNISYNKITSLDLESNLEMSDLLAISNHITEIKLTHLTKLTRIDLDSNKLVKLDVSNLKLLESVVAYTNQLTTINVDNCTSLKELAISNNDIKSIDNLDFDSLGKLESLKIAVNQIYNLPVEINKLTSLQHLDLVGNFLPVDYEKTLNNLAFTNFSFAYQTQDKLILNGNQEEVYNILSKEDISNIDLYSLIDSYYRKMGIVNFPISPENEYRLTSFYDENDNIVDINDYIEGDVIKKNGTLYAKITVNSSGIFESNGINATSTEPLKFNFKAATKSTLSFDLNGMPGTAPEDQILYSGTLAKAVNNPEYLGYTFEQWNTAPDGSGQTWNFDNTKMPNENIKLYAIWSEKYSKLEFDLNNETNDSIEAQSVKYNELAKSVTSPTKEGYTFIGWNTKLNGDGDNWDFATTKMPDYDVTLYAQYSINKYNLVFNLNDGKDTIYDDQEVVFNQLANTVIKPNLVGHDFIEWNTQANGSGDVWDFSTSKMPANNVILYAKWSAIKYELSFDLNGGTGDAIDKQDVAFDTLATKPTTTPTKVGYTFDGWNTQANGSGDTWDFATSKMTANNVTLYAKWSKESHIVTFDLNGGTSELINNQNIFYNELVIKEKDPTRVGYTFKEWNTKNDGNGDTWDFATTKMPNRNITLYAIWTVNIYTIEFMLNDGTDVIYQSQAIEYGKLSQSFNNPSSLGLSFINWNTKIDGSGVAWNFATSKMPAENVKLYGKWEALKFNLFFDINGANSGDIEKQEVSFNTLATGVQNPSKTGYTFVEWNTKADGSGDTWNFATSKMPANDVTLFAKWKIKKYTLKFELNTLSSHPIGDQLLDYDKTSTAVAIPSKTGYTFVEWNTKADGSGDTWNFTTSKMPANDVTLYAQWIVNYYSIQFDGNSGQGNMPKQDFKYQESKKLNKNEFKKTNYKFIGWATTQNGKVELKDEEVYKYIQTNNVILYAQWQRIYSIPESGIEIIEIKNIALITTTLISILFVFSKRKNKV